MATFLLNLNPSGDLDLNLNPGKEGDYVSEGELVSLFFLPVESQSNSGDLALNMNPKERNSVPALELGRL